MIRVHAVELREIHLPLVHYFETSFGRTYDRRIILVTVKTGDGVGYGECTAAEEPGYSSETTETAWHMLADFIIPRLLGRELEDAGAVAQDHFRRLLEQHLMGGPTAAGQSALSIAERRRIAVHEAGHALVARLLNVGVVEKVSILKRGRALGVTLVTSEQDATLQSEPELRARMTMLLGGRGAEALVLKTASTGAANDLEHVSTMAYRMVTEFGFSKNIGPFSYAGLPDRERHAEVYSEAITEAREITKDIERQCAEILLVNREALDLLTAELLEHETVSGEIVDACLVPGGMPGALAA